MGVALKVELTYLLNTQCNIATIVNIRIIMSKETGERGKHETLTTVLNWQMSRWGAGRPAIQESR